MTCRSTVPDGSLTGCMLCRQLKDHIWTFAAGLRALGLQEADKVQQELLCLGLAA